MDTIIVRILDLPHGINGITVLDANGDYNVYISARPSCIEQMKTLLHEKRHIELGHFYSLDDLVAIEAAVSCST